MSQELSSNKQPKAFNNSFDDLLNANLGKDFLDSFDDFLNAVRATMPDPVADKATDKKTEDMRRLLNSIKAGRPPKQSVVSSCRVKAEKISKSISQLHGHLQNILKSHEPTIRRRWKKKTAHLRRKILLDVWPGMPLRHRLNFTAFRKTVDPLMGQMTGHRGAFLNQEDLIKPDILLLLLSSRARHSPSAFAGMDKECLSIETMDPTVAITSLTHHTMILHEVDHAADYGKIVSWKDVSESFEWLIHNKQVPAGLGLLILEFQEKVLDLLVECCKKILHEIPPSTLLSLGPDNLLMPAFQSESDATNVTSLAQIVAEAPYRPPLIPDFTKVVAILRSTVLAHEDHLWFLREDPGYFSDFLLEHKSHLLELLPDAAGEHHPGCKSEGEALLWKRVLKDMMFEMLEDYELTARLLQSAETIAGLHIKYGGNIVSNTELSAEYYDAFGAFKMILAIAITNLAQRLECDVPASPPLRHLFYRATSSRNGLQELGLHEFVARRREAVRSDKMTEHLLWLFNNIKGQDEFDWHSLPAITDELERLLQSEPLAKALITSKIAATIGMLSVLRVCIQHLSIYERCRSGPSTGPPKVAEELALTICGVRGMRAEALRLDSDRGSNVDKLVGLLLPLRDRFYYPVERRRTKENVAILRKAEANLDAFWSEMERTSSFEVAQKGCIAIKRLSLTPRSLRRTAEWIEPESIDTPNNSGPKPNLSRNQPLSELYFELEHRTTATLNTSKDLKATPKAKIKTKAVQDRVPSKHSDHNNEAQPDGSGTKSKNRIIVGPRAFKVFRTLFFDPDVTSTPGEVPWNDFVGALTSIGFKAEKLYGSVWQFEPILLQSEGETSSYKHVKSLTHDAATTSKYRNIQFHEPHPSSKIPFFVARRHGRRLNRAYGWTLETFKLKEKNKDEGANDEK